jgi:hypothetical protein
MQLPDVPTPNWRYPTYMYDKVVRANLKDRKQIDTDLFVGTVRYNTRIDVMFTDTDGKEVGKIPCPNCSGQSVLIFTDSKIQGIDKLNKYHEFAKLVETAFAA